MNLLLFDIDGTLILSGGAGFRAMTRAFSELFGHDDAFRGVQLAGRTDISILTDAFEKFGISNCNGAVESFKDRYFALLPEEIAKPEGDKRIMPGVQQLLDHLCQLDNVLLALLTGNWEPSGRIKLAHFGLDRYFPFGAFADDSARRDELLPFAVQRFEARTGQRLQPHEVIVIGDTPSDILCAKPHGAVSLAVAAAHYTAEQLQAYEPDHLFDSLQDLPRFLALLH